MRRDEEYRERRGFGPASSSSPGAGLEWSSPKYINIYQSKKEKKKNRFHKNKTTITTGSKKENGSLFVQCRSSNCWLIANIIQYREIASGLGVNQRNSCTHTNIGLRHIGASNAINLFIYFCKNFISKRTCDKRSEKNKFIRFSSFFSFISNLNEKTMTFIFQLIEFYRWADFAVKGQSIGDCAEGRR